MVPGRSCQRRDDYSHEPRYARHRLIASSGAVEGALRTGRQRLGDEGRDLRVRLACDKARTARGLAPLPGVNLRRFSPLYHPRAISRAISSTAGLRLRKWRLRQSRRHCHALSGVD
jgi:hypothetical protein